MSWNRGTRQFHRWASIAFTLAVVANFVVLAKGTPPAWVTYSPLLPLGFLTLTGLYLFVLPHATKWRGERLHGGARPRARVRSPVGPPEWVARGPADDKEHHV